MAPRTTPWTDDERALIERARVEWLAVGRSTAPTNIEETQRAWADQYRFAGRAPVFVWVTPGPVAAHVAMALWEKAGLGAHLSDSLDDSLRASLSSSFGASLSDSLVNSLRTSLVNSLSDSLDASLSDSLRDSLHANLNDSLDASLVNSLRASLGASLVNSLSDSLGASLVASLGVSLRTSLVNSLRASLGASLSDSLRDSLSDSLGASLDDSLLASLDDSLLASLSDSLGASLRDSLGATRYRWTWFWGAHDAYWVGWYRTAQALGVPLTADQDARLSAFERLARNTLWSWPHEHGVVVCDRPDVCAMEEAEPGRWRLHCADGPALHFRDGYSLYAWHGVRVSADVIEHPERITVAAIQTEENAEVRRVMIERLGWDRYLAETGARPVQSDACGDLYRTTIDDADVGVVMVTNSTPEPDGTSKRYALLVPPEHQTARSAVAWTFGLTAKQYQPAVQS